MDFVNDYKNHGGMVAVGSDTGFLFDLWGFGTIRELEMLEEAGFSPLETIHAATENGAKVVKNTDLGLVRPGYLADLVLLSENPLGRHENFLRNRRHTRRQDRKEVHDQCVKYTIRDGVVFDSQALLKDVRDYVSKAKQRHQPGEKHSPAAGSNPVAIVAGIARMIRANLVQASQSHGCATTPCVGDSCGARLSDFYRRAAEDALAAAETLRESELAPMLSRLGENQSERCRSHSRRGSLRRRPRADACAGLPGSL